MSPKNLILYGMLIMSLIFIDFIFGNGVKNLFRMFICKIVCFVKKSMKEHAIQAANIKGPDEPVSLTIVLTEILVLALTAAILQKYKDIHGRDRIDDLLQESREALHQTNAFLDKWPLRQVQYGHTYLDEEPQELEPIKLEVPILHMAIVDTKGTTRSKPERGDAGDTINITDAMLLSVTSLIDENMEAETDIVPVYDDTPCFETIEENVNNEF